MPKTPSRPHYLDEAIALAGPPLLLREVWELVRQLVGLVSVESIRIGAVLTRLRERFDRA